MIPVAIIAGGKGTRIASIAGDLPKALIPVLGTPFLDYQLRYLSRGGARDVVICLGYGGASIREYVGDGNNWDLHVRYSDDGGQPLGTGGAIAKALPLLGSAFLTIYGDALLRCEISQIAAALSQSDDGVMSVFENHDRWLPSNVRVENDRVIAYEKRAKPGTMTHIDYGINAFRSAAFAAFSCNSVFDLSEVHRAMIARGKLRAFSCEQRWFEIGSPEGLAQMEQFLRSK